MPAHHNNIIGGGLATEKFLRNASESSVGPTSLASKDAVQKIQARCYFRGKYRQ